MKRFKLFMTLLNNKNQAFTLIELLIVIAIIGILSTLAMVALGSARVKSRDAKRVADIRQISTALELYYEDHGYYPSIITPGNSLVSQDGNSVYLSVIPNNPEPRNDSNCGNNNYTYSSTLNNSNYTLNYCLATENSSSISGISSYSNLGPNTAPGLIGWWKFDEASGTIAYDSSGHNKNGTIINNVIRENISNCLSKLCLNFDGVANNNYIRINFNDDYFNVNDSLTLVSYVKLKNLNQRIYSGVISNYWAYQININSAEKPQFIIVTEGSLYSLTSPNSLLANSWYQIIGVYNRSEQPYLRLYVNGSLVASSNTTNKQIDYNNHGYFSIGALDENWTLDGYIDEVRIYNRALSDSEITALYEASK